MVLMKRFFKQIKTSPSTWVVILLSIFLTHELYQYVPWKKNKVLVHDINVYYSYLPATFVYGDWSFSYLDEIRPEMPEGVFPSVAHTEDGKPVQKTTMGVALMQAPFFLMGQAAAKIGGYPDHGFSRINQNFLSLGALFYAVLSLIFFRKLFRLYFNELITSLMLAVLFVGTNVFFYSIIEGPMAHIHNLALLAIFFYYGIKWIEKPDYKKTIVLGVCAGLLLLLRPTNILFLSFFVLFGLTNKESVLERLKLISKHVLKVGLMILVAFGVFFIQMIYWKTQTGHWLYYSYEGEQFYLDNPHLLEGLFGYRKGLLVYSPILILGFMGWIMLFFRKTRLQEWRGFILLIIPAYLYLMMSWWCWWYGGGFGHRGSIEVFPLIVLAMGALLSELMNYKKFLVYLFIPLIAGAIYLNYEQTFQFIRGVIHYDGMTKDAYWEVFLKEHQTVAFYDYLSLPDYDNARNGKPEYTGWQIMDSDQRESNVLSVSHKDVTDSITVKGTMFSDIKTDFALVHLIVRPDPVLHDSEQTIIPVEVHGFRDLPFKIEAELPSKESLNGRPVLAYLHYSGFGRALYKSIILE